MPIPMTPDDARIDEINDLTEERNRLQDQIKRFNLARAEDADLIEQLRADINRLSRAHTQELDAERAHGIGLRDQLDTMRADLAKEVSNRMTAAAERDSMARQITDLGMTWINIGQPFHTLCERVIDPTRLVGLEIEIENGDRFIIGDVNPGGIREGGQAFRRDATVTRARLRVRK